MNWSKIENRISKNWKEIDFLKTDLNDHRLIEKESALPAVSAPRDFSFFNLIE